MPQVYLALGSNIEPEENFPAALAALDQRIGLLAQSSIWQAPAVGSEGPDFWNAVILIETQLSAAELKQKIIRPLEAELGRVRTEDKNAPRQMDIDILLYDGELYEEELWQQAHLAIPLAELWPDYTQPDTGQTIQQIAQRHLSQSSIQRISPET